MNKIFKMKIFNAKLQKRLFKQIILKHPNFYHVYDCTVLQN